MGSSPLACDPRPAGGVEANVALPPVEGDSAESAPKRAKFHSEPEDVPARRALPVPFALAAPLAPPDTAKVAAPMQVAFPPTQTAKVAALMPMQAELPPGKFDSLQGPQSIYQRSPLVPSEPRAPSLRSPKTRPRCCVNRALKIGTLGTARPQLALRAQFHLPHRASGLIPMYILPSAR